MWTRLHRAISTKKQTNQTKPTNQIKKPLCFFNPLPLSPWLFLCFEIPSNCETYSFPSQSLGSLSYPWSSVAYAVSKHKRKLASQSPIKQRGCGFS